VLKDRLNIDCLRMLSYQDDDSDYEQKRIMKPVANEPKKDDDLFR